MKRLALSVVLAVAGAALLAGCGDDDESSAAQDAPEASAFPDPGGRTLEKLLAEVTPEQNLVVSPAGRVFDKGKNRFAFGVFELDRSQVTDASVAIYVAHGPEGKALGPFPARVEDLSTDPGYAAETTSTDPDAAQVVYITELPLDGAGEWRALAMIDDDGTLRGARVPSLEVGTDPKVPDVGQRAPRVHTPTTEEVGGDLSSIDTRNPHDSQHSEDLADVIGKKPVVLLFATPALCQSRVCGPVVDIAEQVKDETDEDVAFIHMEVFNENDPNAGLRPQLQAYGLPTEPWLFVIDAKGVISARAEGAFSATELTDWLSAASG